MPFPLPLVNKFFQLLTAKKTSAAENILEKIKERSKIISDWDIGYMKALEGMLLALKGTNKRAFIKVKLTEDRIQKLEKKFRKKAQNTLRIIENYDRGFFAAWADYLNLLLRIKSVKKA
jgi:cell division protein ZapA (FtsZ GTPase activity inhibitor)